MITLCLNPKIQAFILPHYETDKKNLIKGVVPDELVGKIKDEKIQEIRDLGFMIDDSIESPILGGAGNKEYFLLIKIPLPADPQG